MKGSRSTLFRVNRGPLEANSSHDSVATLRSSAIAARDRSNVQRLLPATRLEASRWESTQPIPRPENCLEMTSASTSSSRTSGAAGSRCRSAITRSRRRPSPPRTISPRTQLCRSIRFSSRRPAKADARGIPRKKSIHTEVSTRVNATSSPSRGAAVVARLLRVPCPPEPRDASERPGRSMPPIPGGPQPFSSAHW